MARLLAALLILFTFVSCNKTKSLLPNSGGNAFEVVLINDSTGAATRMLQQPLEGLPQQEPTFTVVHNKTQQLEGVIKYSRCILNIAQKGYWIEKNKYAAPQLIVHSDTANLEKAIDLINKFEMKKALRSSGVQTARFYCVHNETELEEAMNHLAFPVILKAVDLMGSRGIYRSDTRDEARQNFRRSMQETRKDYCLIEEFIEGELFGAEAMIQNGKLLFILPDNTEAFLSTTPTPIGHSIPFRDEEMLGEQVRRQVEAAVKAIGLDNCPVNCDLIKKDGRVYIIELTGRSGATGLSEMTGAWFGCNYYEVIVRLALGEDVSRFFDHPTGTAFLSHTLISRRTGRVRQIINHNLPQPEVRDLSFNIRAGDEVRSYTNGRDRIGQVMIQGKSLDQCEQKLQEVLRNIHIVLEGDPEE